MLSHFLQAFGGLFSPFHTVSSASAYGYQHPIPSKRGFYLAVGWADGEHCASAYHCHICDNKAHRCKLSDGPNGRAAIW